MDDSTILSKVEDLPTLRTTHIGQTLEYACQFWASHLAKVSDISDGATEIFQAIDDFFETGFLSWVEVLILTKNLDVGVYALNDIEQWYTLVSHAQNLHQGLYSCLFRQELPASGSVIASFLSWTILIQSSTLLPGCITLLSDFALPHPGSISATLAM